MYDYRNIKLLQEMCVKAYLGVRVHLPALPIPFESQGSQLSKASGETGADRPRGVSCMRRGAVALAGASRGRRVSEPSDFGVASVRIALLPCLG